MKPPKLVYIGHHDIDVTVKGRLDNDNDIGEFNDEGISLLNKQRPSKLRDTMLHESMHAIIYFAGLREALELDKDAEEKIVVTLTPWLLALMRDNPKLVEFLMENREREY